MILCIIFRSKVGAPIVTGFLCAVWVWVFPNRLLRLHSLFPVYIAVGVIIILLWIFDLYLYAQRKMINAVRVSVQDEDVSVLLRSLKALNGFFSQKMQQLQPPEE